MAGIVFDKFGNYVTNKIKKNPKKARKFLAKVFNIYAFVLKLTGKKDLKARNLLLADCNKVMANALINKKRSVLVSIFTPCEFFHALDLDIIFPEGMSCYMTASYCQKVFVDKAEEMGIPETFCSYHKILIGMAYMGVLPKPDCIVNTSLVCDANNLTFRLLADYFKVPHYVIDIPNNYSEANKDYVAAQLKEMLGFVEDCTGRKLDPEKLDEVMARAQRTIENQKNILELKSGVHESTRLTSHMMDSFANHILLGTNESESYTIELLNNLKECQNSEYKPKVRIVWAHVMPYWQTSVNEIFSHNENVEICLCDMSIDHFIDEKLYPTSNGDYFEVLAKTLLLDSFNGVAERRFEKIYEYAKLMKADGIVYFCHWGCKQTMGASLLAKEWFESKEIPMLSIDGDGCDPSTVQDGQMKTRFSAFIEQLERAKS